MVCLFLLNLVMYIILGNYTFFTSSNGWLYLYMNSQPNNVDSNTELICKNTDQNDDVVKTHFREYNNPNDPS